MHAISSYHGNKHTPPQTVPITIHCAAKHSVQCNEATQTLRAGCSKADSQTNTDMGDYNKLCSLAHSVIMEICQKSLTPCVPLFKITQGHWNKVIDRPPWPVSYHFRDKRDNCRILPPLVYLTPPLRGFPLEYCNGIGGIGQTDGRTDRFAITISRSACFAC